MYIDRLQQYSRHSTASSVSIIVPMNFNHPMLEPDVSFLRFSEMFFDRRVGSFTQKAANTLLDRIGDKDLSVIEVAQQSNTSRRSFQRYLATEDMSFKELKDCVRFFHCLRLSLDFPELGIAELAQKLDYKDRTCLTNAFKRWTGYTPMAFLNAYRLHHKKVVANC